MATVWALIPHVYKKSVKTSASSFFIDQTARHFFLMPNQQHQNAENKSSNFVQLNSVFAFSAVTLLVGQQEGHPAGKKFEWCGAGMVLPSVL